MRRDVVTYSGGLDDEMVSEHIRTRNEALARMIAELTGGTFAGEYDPTQDYLQPPYFVPHRTLVGADAARRVGIPSADDLYGGVVPFAFLATKAIAHGLVGPRAKRPRGWSDRFAKAVSGSVLPGVTAFGLEDARVAGERLLKGGEIRVKLPLAGGGMGQTVVGSPDELRPVLESLDADLVTRYGVVLERDLRHVRTYSVGQVHLPGRTASYYGVQRLTTDNGGAVTYGGSDLVIVRGTYEHLLAQGPPEAARRAIAHAVAYDRAMRHYPGTIASRRNYDVGRGLDSSGNLLSGVFEHAWRIGGASGPEVAALRVFHHDPNVGVVEASSFECYGAGLAPPPGALVHFTGTDPESGPMISYTLVTATGA